MLLYSLLLPNSIPYSSFFSQFLFGPSFFSLPSLPLHTAIKCCYIVVNGSSFCVESCNDGSFSAGRETKQTLLTRPPLPPPPKKKKETGE